MKRAFFIITTTTIISIIIGLWVSAASAQETSLADGLTGAAKVDYLGGRALFNDGDFAGALVKFKSVLEQTKDERLYWNLGACERGLKHYAQAIRHLERFKSLAKTQASEQKEADDIITALKPFVAEVTVRANEAGAQVTVDDQPMVGTTPIEKYLVDIGEHKVVLKKQGFTPLTRDLSIKDASPITLDLVLEIALHRGRLSIVAGEGDAITIDGANAAITRYEGTLASGVHLVRVTAAKKKPFESRVVIEDDQLRTLDVTLEPAQEKPLLPLWAWAGIGAATATALVVGGYFLFRSSDEDPKPVLGTLDPRTVQLSF